MKWENVNKKKQNTFSITTTGTFRDLKSDEKMEYLIFCAKRAYRYVNQLDKRDDDTLELYCRSSVCDVSKWSKQQKKKQKKSRIDLSLEKDIEMTESSSSKESESARHVVVKFGQKILVCKINDRRNTSAVKRDTPLLSDVDRKDVLKCVASMTGYEPVDLIVANHEDEIEDDFDIFVSLKSTSRLSMYRFIEQNVSFQIFITVVIVITVIESILSSVKSIDNDHTADIIFNKILEPVAVGIFTLEFLLRFWAVPDDPSYRYIRMKYCTWSSFLHLLTLYVTYTTYPVSLSYNNNYLNITHQPHSTHAHKT